MVTIIFLSTVCFNKNTMFSVSYHLLALDVLKNHTESGAIFTEVSDDSAGALDDLASVTLSVDLAETAPLAKSLTLSDLDQRDVALSAEGLNETDVGLLIAILSEEANLGNTAVQSLDSKAETTLKSLVVEGVLQHLRDGGHDVHLGDDVHAMH